MTPGFEAAAALKYSPYPDPRYRITFEDVFWHLDKESMEETFDRLLDRHTYGILKGFLRGYFETKPDALAAVCEYLTFPAMLATAALALGTHMPTFRKIDEFVPERVTKDITSRSDSEGWSEWWENLKHEPGMESLFEERKRQRREWWNPR